MIKLDYLNTTDVKEFTTVLGDIFEHSPWIAEQTAAARPFSSIRDLHNTMVKVVQTAPKMKKLALIKAHPNLGDRVEMTSDSKKEQLGAGLNDLTAKEHEKFFSLNLQYMDKFGFPFIMAVRGQDKFLLYRAMTDRLKNNLSQEFQTALLEIYKIALFRLQKKVIESGEFEVDVCQE